MGILNRLFGTQRPAPPPGGSGIEIDWTASPAARRNEMRAKMAGIARAPRPMRPVAERVAARALALASQVYCGHLESDPAAEGLRRELLDWVKGLGLWSELERHERALLKTPIGRAGAQDAMNACWRVEGLAVLAWALGRFELPPYDQQTGVRAVAASVFCTEDRIHSRDLAPAKQLLESAELRPGAEIDNFASQITVVNWRLRQFGIHPSGMDFVEYLRRHAMFNEIWLAHLNIANGDLALRGQAIAAAPADVVQGCTNIAQERHRAAYWLQGDHKIYSVVDPCTLLTAC
jgi:hypothetical protein